MPLIRGLRYASMRGLGLLGDSQGGGGSPGYTPSLDFSDERNSQYIGQVV